MVKGTWWHGKIDVGAHGQKLLGMGWGVEWGMWVLQGVLSLALATIFPLA